MSHAATLVKAAYQKARVDLLESENTIADAVSSLTSTYPYRQITARHIQRASSVMSSVLLGYESNTVLPTCSEQILAVSASLFFNDDLVLVSKTGSGKSIAFLASADYLKSQKPPQVAVLISPLMALLYSQYQSFTQRYPHISFHTIETTSEVILASGGLLLIHPSQIVTTRGEHLLSTISSSVGRIFLDEAHLYTICSSWRHDLLPAVLIVCRVDT